MKEVTLCFLMKDKEILLARKKRGFGEGKINGVGGKIEPGEGAEEAAVREVEEEVGVKVSTKDITKVADIDFYFTDDTGFGFEHIFRCHTFVAHVWEGEPIETDEMCPAWHHHDKIPFTEMWSDDIYWLPQVLEGKKLKAIFYFGKDGHSVVQQRVEEVG